MLCSAGQILCRGPKHFDEAKGSLMDRPDSHGAAPSRADQIEQQPVLRIILDMVAGFCTGTRCACCILPPSSSRPMIGPVHPKVSRACHQGFCDVLLQGQAWSTACVMMSG